MGRGVTAKRLSSIISVDIRSAMRDPMLGVIAVAPFFILAVLRYGVPALAQLLADEFGFDLSAHYGFIVGFFVLIPPMLAGLIEGFIVLDERDSGILTYLYVTPLSRVGYLRHRVGIPTGMGFVYSIIILALNGLVEFTPKLIPVACVSAAEAPMMTLFLSAFAANKVEALAISKAIGILYYGPILAYFVDWPLQAIGMISPPYWVTKAFLVSPGSTVQYISYIVAGTLVHAVVIGLLVRRFEENAA